MFFPSGRSSVSKPGLIGPRLNQSCVATACWPVLWENKFCVLFTLIDSIWLEASAVTQGEERYRRAAQSNKERAGRGATERIIEEPSKGYADKT